MKPRYALIHQGDMVFVTHFDDDGFKEDLWVSTTGKIFVRVWGDEVPYMPKWTLTNRIPDVSHGRWYQAYQLLKKLLCEDQSVSKNAKLNIVLFQNKET